MVVEVGYLAASAGTWRRSAPSTRPPGNPRSMPSVPHARPSPNFGRIQLVDNGGNGNYNSLGAKLTKRYSNGLTT